MVATGSGALGASQDRMLIGAGSDADRRAKLLIHLAAERSLLDAYSHAGLVNEVKACTIYCRAGMVELIEMALLCPTVTSGAPVGDQVSKISRFNSVGPSGDPYVRWQTGVCQTISKDHPARPQKPRSGRVRAYSLLECSFIQLWNTWFRSRPRTWPEGCIAAYRVPTEHFSPFVVAPVA